MSPSSNTGVEPILNFVRSFHATGDSTMRYLRLADVEHWIEAQEWEKIRYILRKLPLVAIPATPDFLYVLGHVYWGQHRLEEAKNAFEKARVYYRLACQDLTHAALCALEIADITHSRGDFIGSSQYTVAWQLLSCTYLQPRRQRFPPMPGQR